jgi:hypothetical protein
MSRTRGQGTGGLVHDCKSPSRALAAAVWRTATEGVAALHEIEGGQAAKLEDVRTRLVDQLLGRFQPEVAT